VKSESLAHRSFLADRRSDCPGKDHVSICVCTYRRPNLLRRLLLSVENLQTAGLFEYSVVVVDNDPEGSAEGVVRELESTITTRIRYYHEKERSISLARNRSILESTGNLVAFIDDDEFPDTDWLLNLYRTLHSTGADGVLGPVLPHFDGEPARWLPRSGLCDRERFATGTVLQDAKYTRTGNVLAVRGLFQKGDMWFDPSYGLSGGGDAAFFRRMIAKGRSFVWCDEGCVYETVLPERQTRRYYIRRAFTRGMTSSKHAALYSSDTFRSLAAVILYSAALPILFFLGQHLFVRYLVKDCDHLAKILGRLGIQPVRERPYVG
jgi:succinoglycan biosynthesis protein ExoM